MFLCSEGVFNHTTDPFRQRISITVIKQYDVSIRGLDVCDVSVHVCVWMSV